MQRQKARHFPASTFKTLADSKEPVVFFTGHVGRERQVIALPAEPWADNVAGVYQGVEPLKLTHHTQIDDALIVMLLTCQVDEDWQPWRYAVLEQGDKEIWYVVPATPYWVRRVGEGE